MNQPSGCKLADMTGPGITDKWGVTCADLGASVTAPNGKLMSVFGDTFSGARVGQGVWLSPDMLIGTGDAAHQIKFQYAGGVDPNSARQLIPYTHDDPSTGWSDGGISTMIPSDLLVVGDTVYLHAIANQGFGNVIWTGIWSSSDNGITWTDLGVRFPAQLHNGYAQLWTWDYNPDDGYIYVVSTGFQRDKGLILRRVLPKNIGDMTKYSGWGWANGQWAWGNEPTPISPDGQQWGELTLRRLSKGKWILGGFLNSAYALAYWAIASPTADLHATPLQIPVVGSTWFDEDQANGRVAQVYGGYVLPGSQLDVPGGVGLVVSQWNTSTGWPYRTMQFTATIADTTETTPTNTPPKPPAGTKEMPKGPAAGKPTAFRSLADLLVAGAIRVWQALRKVVNW